MSASGQITDPGSSDLPAGWSWSTLGALSEKPQYGWTTKANHEGGNLRLLRTTDITSGTVDWGSVPFCTEEPEDADKYAVKAGDILISRAGSVGVSFLINEPQRAVFASYLIRFRPKAEIDTKYFYYYLKSPMYWDAIGASKSGIAIPNVNASKLAAVPIPVAPVGQQKRIVAEIEKQFSRLDEAVANLNRVKANLKRYKAAVLKAAVEGRLVETEEELASREGRSFETAEQLRQRAMVTQRSNGKRSAALQALHRSDIASLPTLPSGWTWATMPELGELSRGRSKHRPRDDAKLYGGPYPFIQTGDVRKSDGLITTYAQTYSAAGLQQSRLWPAGTLCITIAANIAETGILTFDGCFPDSVVGFLTDLGPVTTRYVECFLRTARERLERFAPATAQKNINLEVLGAVYVPLPPLHEQERIILEVERRLSISNAVEMQVSASLARAERLRQSVLAREFAQTAS